MEAYVKWLTQYKKMEWDLSVYLWIWKWFQYKFFPRIYWPKYNYPDTALKAQGLSMLQQ